MLYKFPLLLSFKFNAVLGPQRLYNYYVHRDCTDYYYVHRLLLCPQRPYRLLLCPQRPYRLLLCPQRLYRLLLCPQTITMSTETVQTITVLAMEAQVHLLFHKDTAPELSRWTTQPPDLIPKLSQSHNGSSHSSTVHGLYLAAK